MSDAGAASRPMPMLAGRINSLGSKVERLETAADRISAFLDRSMGPIPQDPRKDSPSRATSASHHDEQFGRHLDHFDEQLARLFSLADRLEGFG